MVKNRLVRKAIGPAVWFIAAASIAVSFTVYINVAASSGGKVDTSMHVISGDPAVLAGMHINRWAVSVLEDISTVTRDTVSFDDSGDPEVNSYSQVFGSAREYADYNANLILNIYNKLEFVRYVERAHIDNRGRYVNDIISYSVEVPESQINYSVPYDTVFRYSGLPSYQIVSYQADDYSYFTILRSVVYTLSGGDSFIVPEEWDVSFTSGIFRTDGRRVENILPVHVGSENDANPLGLAYLPETRCLALLVIENNDDLNVYIYHIETGTSDKHYIADFGLDVNGMQLQWWMDWPKVVSGSLFAVSSDRQTVLIETDRSQESVVLRCFRNENVAIRIGEYFIPIHLHMKDGLLHTYFLKSNIHFDSPFSYGSKLYTQVFQEDELIFDGYITLPHVHSNFEILTVSDEAPLIIEDSWAIRQW